LLNRESIQAMWTAPVEASTAIAGSDAPFRTRRFVFGSKTSRLSTEATVIGGLGHVSPLSAERKTAMSIPL
jgi:hypothetical protein